MKMTSGAATAPFSRVPSDRQIYTRSISDDDLCAWCARLIYDPGENSLCQLHNATSWPGEADADGYFIRCLHFQPGPPDHCN